MFKIIITFLLLLAVSVNAGEISIDFGASHGIYDDPILGPTIIKGANVKLAVRFKNDDTANVNGMTNGFRVYIDNNYDGIPDDGISFKPAAIYLNNRYNWEGSNGFFDISYPVSFGCDGFGDDTVGYSAAILSQTTGLPASFDDIAYYIHTGIECDEPTNPVLCIDSTWYPPASIWIWAAPSTYPPDWGGPYCFNSSVQNGLPPYITNIPSDTIRITECDGGIYNFDAEPSAVDPNYYFSLQSSQGSINSITGVWKYTPSPKSYIEVFQIELTVHSNNSCFGETSYAVPVKVELTESHFPGDVTQDCSADISDLVFIIDFMFGEGPSSALMIIADFNGSGNFDISDVVYLKNYFFYGGPPPFDPFE